MKAENIKQVNDKKSLQKLTEAEILKGRSFDYYSKTGQEQWDEDKRLGILDWDGK